MMTLRCCALLLLGGVAASVAAPHPSSAPPALVARAGDTGFVKVAANSFTKLSPKQQELAYWLGQAAIAIDPIIYDQLSAYGLREKRLLEEIQARPAGIEPKALRKITE